MLACVPTARGKPTQCFDGIDVLHGLDLVADLGPIWRCHENAPNLQGKATNQVWVIKVDSTVCYAGLTRLSTYNRVKRDTQRFGLHVTGKCAGVW